MTTTKVDPGALLDTYAGALVTLEQAKKDVADLEFRIFQLIDEVPGRLILPNFLYTCEIVPPSNKYNDARLAPFKELLSDDDLATCWKQVDRWDMRKLIPLAKRLGFKFVDLVEGAKEQPTSRGKLKFERKKHAA
jgi:hypothetical protein